VVSRCANPKCSKPFHYLHEGKLFRLMFGYPFQRFRSKERRVEYLWLCAECAPKYLLSWDCSRGTVLVPVRSVPEAADRKLVIAIGGPPPDRAQKGLGRGSAASGERKIVTSAISAPCRVARFVMEAK
jgi:hypothetical protein